MSDRLTSAENAIKLLVARQGDEVILDLDKPRIQGCVVRCIGEHGRIRLYLVDSRPGRSAMDTRMDFYGIYTPLLNREFGLARVSKGAGKLRVSGKLRPVPYLVVNLS